VVIPSGTTLFIPGVGILAYSYRLPGGLLRSIGSVDGLFARFPISDMYGEEVVIDGKPVAGLEDGNHNYLSYYGLDGFETGVFPMAYSWDGSVYEFTGYLTALLVNPLPPGEHVIKMKGKSKYVLVGPYETDVTYYITVTPGKE
jgi:hypothetical protein